MVSRGFLFQLCLLLPLLLAGCASHKVMYDGPARSAAQVVTLRGFAVGQGKGSIVTQIRAVDGVKIQPDNMLPNSVELLPGRHRIGIDIYSSRQYRTANVDFDFEAGSVYEVRFADSGSTAGVSVIDRPNAYLFEVNAQRHVVDVDQWGAVQQLKIVMPPTTIYIR